MFQFSKDSSALESFWMVAGNLHFIKGSQFCFMEDLDTDWIFHYFVKIKLIVPH